MPIRLRAPTTGRDWDLRLCQRCLKADLGAIGSESIEELAERFPVVAAFLAKRSAEPIGRETIQGLGVPIYSLHLGAPGGGAWRGATWHDRRSSVVWLLAFGGHRDGDRGDIYGKVMRLAEKGDLMPTAEDYELLLVERNNALVPALVRDLTALVSEARASDDVTCVARLAGLVDVRLRIRTVPTNAGVPAEERIWLAVDTRGLEPGWLEIIRTVAVPDTAPQFWEYATEFPERPGSRYELRFRLSRPADEE